jgi:hypothetical protein
MFSNLFNETCDLIDEEWITCKRNFRTEREYQKDLANFLRKELNRSDIFSSRNVTVTLEGGSNCDIAINEDEIGIELKKDLHSENEINRLMGQLDNYSEIFDDIIVVLAGSPNPHHRDLLRDKIKRKNKNSGINDPRIEIIYPDDKDEDKKEEERRFPVRRI